MNIQLLTIFVVLNIVNVALQTIKSICTVKCGKGVASLVNAIAYGLYTVVVVYTVCDLPLWLKVLVVALANLVGVFIVKLLEEKMRKDKLWKVEATVPNKYAEKLHEDLKDVGVSHTYFPANGYYHIFNIYCPTQEVSKAAKQDLIKYEAKYFVTESKVL